MLYGLTHLIAKMLKPTSEKAFLKLKKSISHKTIDYIKDSIKIN